MELGLGIWKTTLYLTEVLLTVKGTNLQNLQIKRSWTLGYRKRNWYTWIIMSDSRLNRCWQISPLLVIGLAGWHFVNGIFEGIIRYRTFPLSFWSDESISISKASSLCFRYYIRWGFNVWLGFVGTHVIRSHFTSKIEIPKNIKNSNELD